MVPPGVLPDQGHHGWRYAGRGPDGKLYVAVGAPCNVCAVEGFEGTIVRLRPDGHELEIFARGIRNSVGFDWHPLTGELFFTDNGGDDLGDDSRRTSSTARRGPGLHFGFPYVYGDGVPYPQFAGAGAAAADDAARARVRRPTSPRSGSTSTPARCSPRTTATTRCVAQHGSWNRSEPIGYRIMRVRFTPAGLPSRRSEVFIDGWLGADGSIAGRPVDLEELPDGSLLISDDHAGLIYRVTYQP